MNGGVPEKFKTFPRWSQEAAALLFVGLVTFGFTHFIDNGINMARFDDRVLNLEKTMIAVQTEQRINSDFRIKSQQKLEDIERVTEETNQMMRRHEAETVHKR